MTQKLIYVPPYIGSEPLYMFVGEAPGDAEETDRVPFIGRSGQFLRNSLNELGVTMNDVIFTNVVKVRPEDNRPPTSKELMSWLPLLNSEVEEALEQNNTIKIIALGKTASKALSYFAMDDYYELEHPSFVLRFNKVAEWKNKLKVILESSE